VLSGAPTIVLVVLLLRLRMCASTFT